MCVLVDFKSFTGSGKKFVSKFIEPIKHGIERTNFEVSSHALDKLSSNHKEETRRVAFVKKWFKYLLPECTTYICVFKEIVNFVSSHPAQTVDTFEAILNFINDIANVKDKKVILIISEFQQVRKVEKYGNKLCDALFSFFNQYKNNKYRFWTIVESSDSLYFEEESLWRDMLSYDFVEVEELTPDDIKSVLVPNVTSEEQFNMIYEKIGGVAGLWKHVVREMRYLLRVQDIKVEDAIIEAVKKFESAIMMGLELQVTKWERNGFKESLAKIQSQEGLPARFFQVDPYYDLIKSNLLYVSTSKLIPQNKVVAQVMKKLVNNMESRQEAIPVHLVDDQT